MEAVDPIVDLGPDAWRDPRRAGTLEWLSTNGMGGYACGTVGGLLQRRWHGLLVAATDVPAGRTMLVPKIEIFATVAGREWSLTANEWSGSGIDAPGLGCLVRVHMAGAVVVRHWRFGAALLEERIAMARGRNATAVVLTLRRAPGPVRLRVKTLVNRRPHDQLTRPGSWKADIAVAARGLQVAFEGASGEGSRVYLQADGAKGVPDGTWYRDYLLPVERGLGYDCIDASVCAGELLLTLQPGRSVGLTASTRGEPAGEGERIVAAALRRSRQLLAQAGAAGDHFRSRLVLSADQFIVERPLPGGRRGTSVIAGYPWFADWSRDALISLPGLLLSTGRHEEAASLLRSLAAFQKDGLLPNRFPAPGEAWMDNSVDAPLLLAEAARRTVNVTRDLGLARDLWPALQAVVDHFIAGTGHGIRVDPADGLVSAGEPGVQLTWMDAKVHGRVITPRMGKPVEINALWCGLLQTMVEWGARLRRDTTAHARALAKARRSFGRFLRPDGDGLMDVLDGPEGHEACLRPNQLLALTGPQSLVTAATARRILARAHDELLTPYGLRTLGPREPGYVGRFEGPVESRDAAYHMGTVWPWLLGPHANAARRFGSAADIDFMRQPFVHHLREGCVGQVCEVADGDAPQRPGGCFAQAWSVAALLDDAAGLDAPTRSPR
ncbi:MAG: glycogen debranching protein [Planctomycetes bacterium]|nr:glycogen debranching protein [Planctomycetota bacterium]